MEDSRKRIEYSIGQKYFNFTILSRAPNKISKNGYTYTQWKCICDCGKEFVTTTKQIRKSIRKSCGCLSKSNRFKQIPLDQLIVNVKFGHYTYKAAERKIQWGLTLLEFTQLIFSNCAYCGQEPSMKASVNGRSLLVNGVDRINNENGYFILNCAPCCKTCNRAKSDMNVKDFQSWAKKVAERDIQNYG